MIVIYDSDCKAAKCHPLFNSLGTKYTSINFATLSMSTLGILGASSDSLLQMLHDLHFDINVQKNIDMKASNIAISCSCYIYCIYNRQWICPKMLKF